MIITSDTNPKIKLLLKLKQSKYRKSNGLFIVEGSHLVKEARMKNRLVEAYSINEQEGYITLTEDLMKKVASTDTVVKEIGLCKIEENHELSNKILMLDAVQDPGNLGALLRSAKAFGFDTIVLGNGTVDLYNDKVIRSSQGAIFKLNFIHTNLVEFINKLDGYQIYGTDVVNGIELDDVKLNDRVAIILGNEGNGISNEVKAVLNKNIYIPMDDTESLNVSVAGSIIMYKLR